jgi:cobalt-zinc-cadmium efflux system membrane fusion protein
VSNVTLTAAQRQHIRILTVAATKFHRSVEANGIVGFDDDQATSVLAPFSGPVSRLLVAPGDRVKKGAVLAEVDSPDFAAAIGAYRKALATANTNRRLADLDKDLLEHDGVARREAEQAETDAANAEADRDAALQALVALNANPQSIKDLQDGKPVAHASGLIRSPVAGTVVEKLITPGQLLEAGTTPAFTVADLSRVWVMTQLFGTDVAAVRVGDSADVLVDGAAAPLHGKVENIPELVDPDTRSVTVRVAVDNPGAVLKKQMYVRVRIQGRLELSGLLIPVSALLRDDDNLPFVYLTRPDGSFTRQHVTVGERDGDNVEITAGLKDGDSVVVDGAIFVQFIQTQ